jgi:Nuclease A inhibitor-like protein
MSARRVDMSQETSSVMYELTKAADGLTFMSESDYPLKPFVIEGDRKQALTAKDILKAMKHSPKAKVQMISVDDFFCTATESQDWHGPEERKTVKRFQNLVKVLKESLRDIQVFKVGKIESDVYVVGKTESGDFAGVSTKVIET